jgi:predicted glycosyltransferase
MGRPEERPTTRASGTSGGGGVRIALYSHDTMGIGHMRRNLLVAQALSGPPFHAATLLIAGAREASAFPLPSGVDCLTLPALHKGSDGEYSSRNLELTLPELTALRARTILAAVEAFEPDVLIVDKVPRGAVRELDPTLAYLYARGRTRCVLGLRDVLDEPEVVRREWMADRHDDAIRTYYDAIWVYGDAAVYDPVVEYGFARDIADRVRYTGYLDPRVRTTVPGANSMEMPAIPPIGSRGLVLCEMGGGQDGARVAEAFMDAQLPDGMSGLLLTGPFMPRDVRHRLRRQAAQRSDLKVMKFLTEPGALLGMADRVVAMGGYNTICEILAYGKRALVIPRTRPRLEQWIRAERLQRRGLIDVLHPDDATPAVVGAWLQRDVPAPPELMGRVDMQGLPRVRALLAELLETPRGDASAGRAAS